MPIHVNYFLLVKVDVIIVQSLPGVREGGQER